MNRIQVQIDRLRKIVIEKFNVPAASGRLTLRSLDIGPKNSPQTRVVTALQRPIKLASVSVDRYADTPFPRIRSRSRIAQARIHESFTSNLVRSSQRAATALPSPSEIAVVTSHSLSAVLGRSFST